MLYRKSRDPNPALISQVSVYRKPIISLISTGNELLTQETSTLEIGKIYDVNSIVLKKAIENSGANVKLTKMLIFLFTELG